LREAYGPAAGFLFGWSLLLVIQTGTIAAVAVAFARFMGVLAPQISESNYIIAPTHLFFGYAISLSTAQLVAIVLILLLTISNTRGLKTGKLIQNTFTFTKTAALIGLILVGLLLGWNNQSAAYTSDWWNPLANGWNPQTAQPGLASTGTTALLMLLGLAMVGPLFAQSEQCGYRNNASRFWPSRYDHYGRGDHDLYVWLQQRFDSRRRARLLRDGPRQPVFQTRWFT
jgi:APA family basic amino acid/polyamine antiporter